MDSRQQMDAWGLAALDLPIVQVSRQTKVDIESIGPNHAARLHALPNESMQAFLGQIGHPPQPNSTNSLAVGFGGNHKQGLVLRQAAYHPFFLAAPVGLVDLDQAMKTIPARSNHRSPQLVQQSPSRLVAAQPENPLQPKSTDTVLLGSDMPHRPEPGRQRKMTVLEDRTGSHRNLAAALPTEPQATLHRPSRSPAAPWADEPIGPTKGKQVTPASLVGRKSLFQLLKRPRIVFHPGEHYKLWQVESSKYPYCGLRIATTRADCRGCGLSNAAGSQ